MQAASAKTAVYRREYEAIRGELERRGFALAPEVALPVADAFLAEAVARAPAPRLRAAGGA